MLKKIIKIEVFLLPFYALGVFIGGKYISQGHILAGVIAALFLFIVLRRNLKFKKYEILWSLPFWFFLTCAMLGLFASPFGSQIWAKGLIQIVGIVIMLLMAIAMVISLQKTVFLLSLVRIMIFSLGLFSIVGILQFIFYNLTSFGKLLDFSFLNRLAGGEVWRDAGVLGPLHRANSFAAEPAHFTRYLITVAGLALLRLGFLGKVHRKNVSSIMPLWVSMAIMGGYLVSLSILGWLLLGLIGAGLLFMSGKLSERIIFSSIGLVLILVSALVIVATKTENAFFDKVRTITLIFANDISESQVEKNQMSALAVASNMVVAENNFLNSPLLGGGVGSHPLAYDIYAPSYVYTKRIPALFRLNADDASSLFLRLLSESGLLGLISFVGGGLAIIYKARKILVRYERLKNPDLIHSLSLGLSASFASIFVIYLLRAGHYYDPVFWISLAFAASIPSINSSFTKAHANSTVS